MLAVSLEQIIPELRDAIGPVILISGVGLLLLTMTNRLGRTIDRARQLKAELSKRTDKDREQVMAQVTVIYQRAKLIRLSIGLASLSAVLAAALIITVFLMALFQWQQALLAGIIFIGSMVSLFASLIVFMWDINLSLHALKLELEDVENPKAGGAI
jgi:multidrug efflux pump subunit AcrB